MMDAEAEAVLRALADPLNWSQRDRQGIVGGIGWAHTSHTADAGKDQYHVFVQPGRLPLAQVIVGGEPDAEMLRGGEYNSVADAKAACERHYATGKWDRFTDAPQFG